MNNSTIIKVFTGIICVLFVIAGIVWFVVYQQHQKGQKSTPQETSEQVEESNEEAQKPSEEAAIPTKEPILVDDDRLANPMKEFMVPSELAKSLGITKENYPRIDGSTSTFELSQDIYWEMFMWDESLGDYQEDMGEPKAPAKTIPSYKSLIAGEVDLIIVPDPSQAVKDLEEEMDVELEYIPIGREGLVFVTQKDNPVANVTIEQINQIYADMTITNWSQLGGGDGEILALCRNDESGSQAQFDNLVMQDGKQINPKIREKYMLDEMSEMLWTVSGMDPFWIDGGAAPANYFPLGYSIYYYVKMIEDESPIENIKMIAVDGIMPTEETIASNEYPLAMGYFAVIRKSTPQDAPARTIANWLTTPDGQRVVSDAGLGKISTQ